MTAARWCDVCDAYRPTDHAHQPSLFDDALPVVFSPAAGGARRTDPASSQASAQRVSYRTGSQRHRLLMAWEDGTPLTREEAAIRADLNLRSNYRARASELRDAGLIVTTGDTRKSTLDGVQQVYEITDRGRDLLGQMALPGMTNAGAVA